MTDCSSWAAMMNGDPTESVRALVLDAAREAVTKDRAATHGGVEDSFGKIAGIWSVLAGVTITPAQVALMLGALKTVRAWGNPDHPDNWVDLAGYAACGGEIAAQASVVRAKLAPPPAPGLAAVPMDRGAVT
jgi:Domain of unknown function (DUF6378)